MLDTNIQYDRCIKCEVKLPVISLFDTDYEDTRYSIQLCLSCLKDIVDDFANAKPIKIKVEKEVTLDMCGRELTI